MPAFFLTLIAAALATMGGRDQRLVAQLSDRLGQPVPVLVAAMIAATGTTAIAAYAATLTRQMPMMEPAPAKLVLVALAMLLAAVEMIWNARRRGRRPPSEPAQSFFATLVVLVAHQIGDGARFLIFALAIYTEPPLAAAGGALGGIAALGLGWAMGERAIDHPATRTVRIILAGGLAIAALAIALPIVL